MKQIVTFLMLITSISFSQDFWKKSFDITMGSDVDSYVNSIATNNEGHLYSFYYYDCDSNWGCEAFLFSDDNGDTWSEKSMIDTNSVFLPFYLTINNHGDIFAWSYPKGPRPPEQSYGLFRSADNGETWTMLYDGHCSSLLINSIGVIYIRYEGRWKRSFDNGDSWEEIWNDKAFGNILIDEDDNIFCTSGDKIYKSIDDGENWYLVIDVIQDAIHKLVKNSKGDLIIKTNYNQLLILPEGIETTSVLIDSLHHGGMSDHTDLYIDNEDNIYVLQEDEGILFSADNGTNWTELNSGIEDLDVRCMVQNVDGYLFVGTDDGIYRSADPITNIKENVSSEKLQKKFQLSQNYPNPFNPSTTIKYSLPKQSNITLKVFDVLGSKVVTLVNKEQLKGSYEVEFDGSELTSGIYFYRLTAGDFVETKKMILLK